MLGQLAGMPAPQPRRVIVTDNRRETALRAALRGRVYPFELVLVENQAQAGFGANHNRAFAKDQELGASVLFAVVNPDLRLLGNPFPAMAFALGDLPNSGLSYPRQLDGQGRVQDAERRLPTPGRLWRRYLCPRQDEVPAGTAPDWVNAACLLLRHEAYARIQGFDERYHMYCEDVDLCLRMQLAGGAWFAPMRLSSTQAGVRAAATSGTWPGTWPACSGSGAPTLIGRSAAQATPGSPRRDGRQQDGQC